MNPFESFLLSDAGRPQVGAEVLELLGRKAANQFLQDGTPLNDTVRQAVSDHPELGNEHIKRVIEFANNMAFQELFSKSEDKNVHFDIADPGVVIRDLKDGGSPAHDGKTMGSNLKDYHQPPEMNMEKDQFGDPESGMQHLQTMSGQNGRMGQGEQLNKEAYEIEPEDRGDIPKKDFAQPNKEEEGHKGKYPIPDKQHAKSALGFAKMHGDTGAMAAVKKKVEKKFPEMLDGKEEKDDKEKESCGDMAKMAAEMNFVQNLVYGVEPEDEDHNESTNPVENVYALHTKLATARTELVRANEELNLLAKQAHEEFYQAVKAECLAEDGAGLGSVVDVLGKFASDDVVTSVMGPVVERMVSEQVPVDRLQGSLKKTAGVVPNTEHPLIKSWAGLIKAAEDQVQTRTALEEIDAGLTRTRAFLGAL
jgi:hypothetical protein